MVCPEMGCSSADCHAWDSFVNRYHQASDASLSVWLLTPAAVTVGVIALKGLTGKEADHAES